MTDKKDTALKPCPFCGGVPNVYEDTVDAVGVTAMNGGHYIGTCSTKCRVRFGGYFTTKEEAIKVWNTRANTVNDELVEALEDVIKSYNDHEDGYARQVLRSHKEAAEKALAKARGEA